MAAQKTEYTPVVMTDGRTVQFPGKRKLVKETYVDPADGSLKLRIDVRNGETRTYTMAQAMVSLFALHGMSQKFGDEIAALEDLDDCVEALDALDQRLQDPEGWATRRDSSGMAGVSILAKALVEVTGKTIVEIRAFLDTKSHAEKAALRASAKLAPVVARLEEEKAKRSNKTAIDAEALLGELDQ